jgi:hypothetical protein
LSRAIDGSIIQLPPLPRAVERASVTPGALTEPAPFSPPAAKSSHHIDGFDVARVLSAFNVVLFHVLAVRNGLWGRGSVIAFVMIAAALPAMRLDLGPFGQYLRRRAHRILLPWAFWSAVYGSIEAARYFHSGHVPGWTTSNLLIGTCDHLWFFVYIFFASLAIWGLLRVLENVPLTVAANGLVCVAAPMILINAHFPPFFDGISPFGIWWRCAPAILLGISFGYARRIESRSARDRLILLTGGRFAAAIAATGR